MCCLVSVAVYIKKVMSFCVDVIVVDGVSIATFVNELSCVLYVFMLRNNQTHHES
jgi:hypothetical protein